MQTPTSAPWQPTRQLTRGNAADQILEDLRGRILGGQLTRGTRLPTAKQLAEGYGVSGPTIREAIRGLTTAQLVEVRHGSGAYVTADAGPANWRLASVDDPVGARRNCRGAGHHGSVEWLCC
jgi:GntR family transcriptional repressor for pyruvate dehydrogenase complex